MGEIQSTDGGSSDRETTVSQLRDVVQQFVDERNWRSFHNPKNLAMSLAIETAELMEHFQWLSLEQSDELLDDPQRMAAVGEELADCLSYVLALANTMQIDLSTTLRRKMVLNRKKYPVDPA
ncbi:nucleotide pyrophosphohydrolase [Stieleria varia]|uniref:MazG nucleotide pyrophosphohydrolase domain protein n=1 Tax=Stieleria varia TaxID=2528005 RepID=A0A5C6AVH1_9BACT|nr:nucleotide pyrophosphohydrolase [Stieleria varia]TWU02124.1 hypothetical protein Pla52n_31730 [Stieleria varia]